MNGYSSTILSSAPFVVSSVLKDFERVFLQTPKNRWRSKVPNPMGVAATHNQRERAFKVIQKYTRLKDQRLIEELYTDSVKFLEGVPRVEPEAIAPIVEFMGKKPIAVDTVADNSIVDRRVREGLIDKLFKLR